MASDKAKKSLKEFLEYLSRSLVKFPDDVEISEKELEDGAFEYTLKVNPEDMGRVIGRNGKTARALRLLVAAKGSLENKKTSVEIAEESDRD